MEQQNGRGRVIYQCMNCNLLCNSSQSLAAHTKGHIIKDGWVKGTRQRKIFVPYDENNQVQQQQQVAPEIDEQQQQQQQVAPEIADTTNVHQAAAQNAQNPPSSPADPASSSKRPRVREHHFGVRDQKILARLIGHLNKEEKMSSCDLLKVLGSWLVDAKLSIPEVEVIPNNDSEAAPVIGNTNKDVVKIEDSDGESISITF
ncbi:hypothetical protein RND71_033825 [Anisodus tanguticus]|uniref:C2H2-type domain-containing protein n=1 Tax=Anisodus tanguticus TaxID=243964 RepID=A0AAE1V1V5_9SOLA|nr:hypothetical protein RND71_033825 [Anisodus tanguticus]